MPARTSHLLCREPYSSSVPRFICVLTGPGSHPGILLIRSRNRSATAEPANSLQFLSGTRSLRGLPRSYHDHRALTTPQRFRIYVRWRTYLSVRRG